MRTKLASALIVIGLLGSSMAPASAVLGLSKCEKVKKQILQEERISISLYGRSKKYIDTAFQDNSVTWGEWSLFASAGMLGGLSDIKVFDLIIKNSSCFSVEMNTSIRIFRQSHQANIRDIQSLLNQVKDKKMSNITDNNFLDNIRNYNANFVSVYDKNFLKKMNP